MDNEFTGKTTTFWGTLSAAFWFGITFLKYLSHKQKTKEAEKALFQTLENKMSDPVEVKVGIKETKECLEAAKAVSIYIIKKVKDGIQVQDGIDIVETLLLDSAFKKVIADAIDKADQVPNELSHLDLGETLEIVNFAIASVPEYLEALKK